VSPDSFLYDPPLLFIDGLVISLLWERYGRPRGGSKAIPIAIAVAILAVFWTVSVSLFLDLPWVEGFARFFHARSGRDWMLNSGIFGFDYVSPPTMALKSLAAILFASYAVWMALGARVGARLAGRPASGP
jgi:hypothetical protein